MKPLLDFWPVPRKYRHDGWTPDRQRAFIAALAETGAVSLAAKAVNMSPEGAYYLRRQPGAEEFGKAWESALDLGTDIVDGNALERSAHGVAVPIFHKGEQVGERRVYNERLTMFLLQHRRPEKYGAAKCGPYEAGEQERAESIRAETMERHDEWLERLSNLYGGRIRMERTSRLAGDVVAADFYLRQLTHMEVLLELGGGGKHLLYWANGNEGAGPAADHSKAVYGTDVTQMLDGHRRAGWAAAGEPDRPAALGNRTQLGSGMEGGPDLRARERALKDARERAAAAQLAWEQAVRDQVAAMSPEPKQGIAAQSPA